MRERGFIPVLVLLAFWAKAAWHFASKNDHPICCDDPFLAGVEITIFDKRIAQKKDCCCYRAIKELKVWQKMACHLWKKLANIHL